MRDELREHWQPILDEAGQSHVLAGWDRLDPAGRGRLASRLAALDWKRMAELSEIARHPGHAAGSTHNDIRDAGPPRHLVRLPELADPRVSAEARQAGSELLAAGRAAAIVVAGGQGTRLGFDQPKGLYPLGPVTGRTLFAMFADQLRALGRRFGRPVPWLVMTSPATHDDTVRAFSASGNFGLDPDNVLFFRQGTLPAFDRKSGRILMSGPDDMSSSPDGHGGMVAALAGAGLLAELATRGIDTLYYHQVDNPLAILCDPVCLGLHTLRDSEVTTKVVAKTGPEEKVGVVAEVAGRTAIVEYSDLPRELAEARESGNGGGLRFWAGNTAIHVFQRAFLERLVSGRDELPFHRAVKKVPYWDPEAGQVQPDTENAIKFERFIFDALPKARVALVVETDRSEEFAPLKNATGEFSPDHVRAGMSARARSWMADAGISVPADGFVEISADSGVDRLDFVEKAGRARTERRDGGWWVAPAS
jgi:UDP-N-acetylglucosamine/UDP-N-acetylgalactosamine diphosphorylase